MDKKEKIIELIQKNKETMNLPLIVQKGNKVVRRLKKRFEEYQDIISTIEEKDLSNNVKFVVDKICDAIRCYSNGKPSEAYSEIKDIFDQLESELLIDLFSNLTEVDGYRQLYRARVGTYYPYKREEMFHIPFNMRESVENQRYSINGVPSLYLGGSIFVCWEELGRPDLKNMYVCRYEIRESVKILNLGIVAEDISCDRLENKLSLYDFEFIKRYLITWPIQCACSILVEGHENRAFFMEYIIPQLLMQVVRESDIKGIIYFSVKGNYNKQRCNPVMLNYVFPAEYGERVKDSNKKTKETKEPKYSRQLKTIFKMTDAYNIGFLINLHKKPGVYTNIEDQLHEKCGSIYFHPSPNRNLSEILINNEIVYKYSETSFFEFEELLKKTKANHLEDMEKE